MIRVNFIKPDKLKSANFTQADLKRIGAKAIELVRNRCARGQNINDRKMKPLSAKYAAKKAALGQPPVRNLMFSGSMLGAMTIVSLDQNQVTVGFTRQAELAKASQNQDRSPFFGISQSDEAKLMRFAESLLKKH